MKMGLETAASILGGDDPLLDLLCGNDQKQNETAAKQNEHRDRDNIPAQHRQREQKQDQDSNQTM